MSETSSPTPPTTGPASAPPARPAPSAPPAQTPAQVPGAAAGSTSAALAAPASVPVPAEDLSEQAGRLEAELAKVRSAARAGEKAVLRVLAPHSSMTWAGHTVTDEPTEVPASAVPGLSEAAISAGVELVQEH